VVEPDVKTSKSQDADPLPAAACARLAFEGAPSGMALIGVESRRPGPIVEVNRAMAMITGREPADLLGRSFAEITDPADVDTDVELLDELLAGSIPAYAIEKRFLKADGEVFWGELDVSLIRDEETHEPRYLIAELADIDERKLIEDALHTSWDRFVGMFDDAPSGMGLASLGKRLIEINDTLCALLGYSEAELLGKPLTDFVVPDEQPAIERYLRELLDQEVRGYHVETRAVRGDGQEIWIELSVSLVHDYGGEPAYIFAQVRDISERKRIEAELEQGTLLDAATALPSRTLLFDRLGQARARLERNGAPFAVMFVRVEGHSEVETRFGRERAAGVLREMGARLVSALRAGDTVARYGSDEFVIVCEDLESEDEATVITERVLDLGRLTVGEGESCVETRVTVGFTVAATTDDDPALLVERADAAMHAARGESARYQEYCGSL
jgi:PAS domain S-box-containing protein/diguanylate cyclase (GGDEF)-like protein